MARNLATHAIDIWIYLIDCNTVPPYAVGLRDFENYCSEFWTMVRMCLFFNNLPSMTIIFQIERRLWKSCQDQERNWCNVHEASWLDFDFVIRHILSIIHLLYTVITRFEVEASGNQESWWHHLDRSVRAQQTPWLLDCSSWASKDPRIHQFCGHSHCLAEICRKIILTSAFWRSQSPAIQIQNPL